MKKTLKNLARGLLDRTVMPISSYLSRRLPATTVLRELEIRAATESADYAHAKMQTALQFNQKSDLWDHAIGMATAEGLVAEFGVWGGHSINHFARKLEPRLVYGFDSFEGLREDWAGSDMKKGSFDMGGRLPSVLPNVRLVKGWFDETLPGFLQENAQPFSLIHVDCDTYEGAKAVFERIGQRVQIGTVLIFDEYFGYRGWKIGEFKAWQEFVNTRGISYGYLGFSVQSVSLRVTSA